MPNIIYIKVILEEEKKYEVNGYCKIYKAIMS